MFETKVMVAPNSPMALAKDKIMPAIIPGAISGNVTNTNTQNELASTPFGRLADMATVATRPLSRTAVHSSGERLSHPSIAFAQLASWPGLSRPSTFDLKARKEGVDARDNPRIKSGDGHDAREETRSHRNAQAQSKAIHDRAPPGPSTVKP